MNLRPNWRSDCPKCVDSKFTCDEHYVEACQCSCSPDGRHQVDTSMESGPNNCFHCEQPMPKFHSKTRPAQPEPNENVWYRGWEIGWNEQAYRWAGAGWDAYKGGCDLGAPRIQHDTFDECLDEIDDYEEQPA